MCQCRGQHDCENCEKIVKNTKGNDEYNFILGNATQILRVAYFRRKRKLYDGCIGTTSYLKLDDGHCYKKYKPEETFGSPKLYLIGGGAPHSDHSVGGKEDEK